MIIAVDGPTASGKGTVARQVAQAYGLAWLDTGTLYRAVGLMLLDLDLSPSDADAATAAAKRLDLHQIDAERVRTAAAGQAASVVAAHPGVRAALLEAQRAFARQPGGAVLDGRDIGTVICPDADAKLFVTASLEVRAQRRWTELVGRGEQLSLEEVTAQIAARDARDSHRADAPLRQAPDAHLLDTTSMRIDEAVAEAVRLIARASGRSPA